MPTARASSCNSQADSNADSDRSKRCGHGLRCNRAAPLANRRYGDQGNSRPRPWGLGNHGQDLAEISYAHLPPIGRDSVGRIEHCTAELPVHGSPFGVDCPDLQALD